MPNRHHVTTTRPRLRLGWTVCLLTVLVVGLGIRLGSLIHGGGVDGIIGYDDGVYYAAALALTGGRLPYRDFLLLHPPAIVVLLTPYAVLGRVTSEMTGLIVARLAWCTLGALNGVLVARLVSPAGRVAALVGGLGYALYFPAIEAERTPVLEGAASSCLLLALLLLGSNPAPAAAEPASSPVRSLLAGLCLGLSCAIKIWGVVGVLAVVAWLLTQRRFRAASMCLLGAAVAVTAVCLPFFAAAPAAMWRMVVLDQFGRPDNGPGPLSRLASILGAAEPDHTGTVVVLVAATLAALVIAIAAMRRPLGAATVLLTGYLPLLFATPSYYPHYAATVAGPLMISVGSAAGRCWRWSVACSRGRLRRAVVSTLVLVGLVGLVAAAGPGLHPGRRFPAAPLAVAARAVGGCVTADQPTVLIGLDVFSRNVARQCPTVVDLDGTSYDLRPRPRGPRGRDPRFQQLTIDHFSAGRACLVTRYHPGFGLTTATQARLDSWPVIASSGGYQLRAPQPPS